MATSSTTFDVPHRLILCTVKKHGVNWRAVLECACGDVFTTIKPDRDEAYIAINFTLNKHILEEKNGI